MCKRGLRKSILIWKKYKSQDLKGLNSTKFLEILHSNTTPNEFLPKPLTITIVSGNDSRIIPRNVMACFTHAFRQS